MTKNKLLPGFVLLLSWLAFTASAETITLKNDRIEACFDTRNGALVKLVNKETGWKILNRKELGQSFEILMPLNGPEMSETDRRYNIIKGIEQKPPVIERKNKSIVFTWADIRSEFMPDYVPVTFIGIVTLTESGLEYCGEVINNSVNPVEYVSWPCIGEITVPDKKQPLYQDTRKASHQLFPHFYNQHGYWGVEYPTSTYEFPEHTFLSVHNAEQGFVFCHKYTEPEHLMLTSFELIPGFELRDTNPVEDEMDGEKVRIQFKANHVLYNNSGEKHTLDPVCLSVYKGSPTSALNYISKSEQARRAPQWLSQPLTWWKVSISDSRQLTEYALEAAAKGVDVLQLGGWVHDSGNELTQVDLLDEAIEKCHESGIRVVLETNWTSINRRSDAYKQKWRKNTVKDPYGIPYNPDIICPLTQDVHNRASEQWLTLTALHKADGFINSDNGHRNHSYICFDKTHGHSEGYPTAIGTLMLDRDMAEKIHSISSDKAALGYGFLDTQNAFYDGYMIDVADNLIETHRALHPSATIIRTVDVRNARKDINNAMLHRLNIAYNLQFHNNHISAFPQISAYGRQIKELRTRYADRIWYTKIIDSSAASTGCKELSHTMYADKQGRRTVIIANNSTTDINPLNLKLDNAGELMYTTPEAPDLKPFVNGINLAPLSVIVIFEK